MVYKHLGAVLTEYRAVSTSGDFANALRIVSATTCGRDIMITWEPSTR